MNERWTKNRKTWLVIFISLASRFLLLKSMTKLLLAIGERRLKPLCVPASVVISFKLHLQTCICKHSNNSYSTIYLSKIKPWVWRKSMHAKTVCCNFKCQSMFLKKRKSSKVTHDIWYSIPMFLLICLCNTAASCWTGMAAFLWWM